MKLQQTKPETKVNGKFVWYLQFNQLPQLTGNPAGFTMSTSPVPPPKFHNKKHKFDHHLPNIWLFGQGVMRPDQN